MATQMEKDRERLEGGTKDIIQQKLKTKLVSGNAPSDHVNDSRCYSFCTMTIQRKRRIYKHLREIKPYSPSPNPDPEGYFRAIFVPRSIGQTENLSSSFFLFFLFLSQLNTFKSNGHIDYSTHEDRSWPICFRVIISPKEIPGSINKFADYSKYRTLSEFWLSNLFFF